MPTHNSPASISLLGKYCSRVPNGLVRVRDARSTNLAQADIVVTARMESMAFISAKIFS